MSKTAYLCVRENPTEAGIFSEPTPSTLAGQGSWKCVARASAASYGAAVFLLEREALADPKCAAIRPLIEQHMAERREREKRLTGQTLKAIPIWKGR